MLNTRIEAARSIAAKLNALEEAIDDALIAAADLTAETSRARRAVKLSPVVGQDAIAHVGETLAALHAARSSIVRAHADYAVVRDEVGLTPKMTGDLWKIMKRDDQATTPLQVVA